VLTRAPRLRRVHKGQTVAKSLPRRPDRYPCNRSAALAKRISTLAAQALQCHRAGNVADAINHYDRILALAPRFSEVHNNRGLALAELGMFEQAEQAYRRADEIRPHNPETLCNWGTVLTQLDRHDEAEEKVRCAIAANPRFAGAYNNLGLILKERGRMIEARLAFEQAIRLSPRSTSYYDNLAALRTFASGDPHLAALEAMAADGAALPAVDRIHLHFALAKAYEHLGDWEQAFRQLLTANALKRAQVAYDEADTLAQMNRARELFTSKFVTDRRGFGLPSTLPVFIVGMPRSGTTLIEQILASHPQIFGGGETSLFEQSANAVREFLPHAPPLFDMAPALSAEHFRRLGSRYVEALSRRAPAALRITDKMPANFLFVGLIHLALPNAAIIHAVRDPVDTCVSCFAVHFTRGQTHTYDLAELGRYYRHYQALMTHWHRVLPPGRILDVHYEELVGDVEKAARGILAHCGLGWDERCLAFYRTERAVRTASAVQVRRPIYTGSIGRWRRFERFLGPLLAELAPTATGITSQLRRAC
jgi:Flp pilus assembly protein TadD